MGRKRGTHYGQGGEWIQGHSRHSLGIPSTQLCCEVPIGAGRPRCCCGLRAQQTPSLSLLLTDIPAQGLTFERGRHADMATAIAAALLALGTLLVRAAQVQARPAAPGDGALSFPPCKAVPVCGHPPATSRTGLDRGSHLWACPCRHGHSWCGCISVPWGTACQHHTALGTAWHRAVAQQQHRALWQERTLTWY